jgi:TusA-related sulfurtransferase
MLTLPNNCPMNSTSVALAEYFIDITGDVCPLTFVKTKLLLEKMPVGAVATVRLKGVQPLDNVPRSVKAHGHEVISLAPEAQTGGASDPRLPHILIVRRR